MHLRGGTQGQRGDNGTQTPLTITVELQRLLRCPVRRTEDV
jgi:hypothetical protein